MNQNLTGSNMGGTDTAIRNDTTGTTNSLTNNSYITGSASAVSNEATATIQTLRNSASGIIESTDTTSSAITNNRDATITSFVNEGIIRGDITNPTNQTIGIGNLGTINSLRNTGKIYVGALGAQIDNAIDAGAGGTASTINIDEWHITLDTTASNFNDLQAQTGYIANELMTNGNTNLAGSIFVAGGLWGNGAYTNNVQGINFNQGAIKLNADTTKIEYDTAYNISSVIIEVDNQGLSSASNTVNGGNGVNETHFVDANPNDTMEFRITSTTITPWFNQNKAISTTRTKTLVDDSVRRTHFIQNVVGASIDGALHLRNVELNGNHIFALPYYNYTDTKNSQTDAYGLITGLNKDYDDKGVFGFYLGYEKAEVSSSYKQEFDDDILYYGLNHYKEFYSDESKSAYLRSTFSGSYAKSDITREIFNDETNIQSYGIAVNTGLNLFVKENHTLSPEFGMAFTRYKIGSYTIDQERYDDTIIHLFQPSLALNYEAQIKNNLAFHLKGGVKFNLDKEIDTRVNDTQIAKATLSSAYGFSDLGVAYQINDDTSVSLNYNLLGSSDLQSHTGYVRVDYKF